MRRRSRTGSVRVTSSPSSRIRPEVGSTSRLIIRSVVDLPQPDGPTSASTSCSRTARLSPATATVPSGYALRTASSPTTVRSAMRRTYTAPPTRTAPPARRVPATPACVPAARGTVGPLPGNSRLSRSYVAGTAPALWRRPVGHVGVPVEAVATPTAIAVPLGVLVSRRRWLSGPVLGVAAVAYTIPSLGLFAILAPLIGIGRTPVLVGLVVYSILIILRNTTAGLATVDPAVVDAARGLGHGPGRLLLQVSLPSALPSIVAGVRLATVSSVALVTVGVVVGFGGLGQIMFQGFRNNLYRAEIMTATIGTILIALVLDLALWAAGRALPPWLRRRAA